MKVALRLLSLITLTNSVTASWQQTYIIPGLQSSYDYIKSINSKYYIAGGTIFVLAMLAYLKKYSALNDTQLLINKLIEQDRSYFVDNPKSKKPYTIWSNPLLNKSSTPIALPSDGSSFDIEQDDKQIKIEYTSPSGNRYRATWRPNMWKFITN